MIDFGNINQTAPDKGHLLIAEPLLQDPFFKRSVILLCEHNDEGSFGFVLNKYTDMEVNELFDAFPTFDGSVCIGGPVEHNNLFYIHHLGEDLEGSIPIGEKLYMGGNFEDLKTLILAGKATSDNLRFFIGYSGWEAEQLAEEMHVNSWIVAPNTIIDPMDTSDDALWESTLKKMGKKYEILTNFPEDPSLN